jgi:hypothetical protein
MDLVWLRLVSQERMLPEPSSHPSLVDPKIQVLLLELRPKMNILEMKPNKKEEFLESHIPLNMVLSKTGMIWKKSGTTLSMSNSEFPQMSTQSS